MRRSLPWLAEVLLAAAVLAAAAALAAPRAPRELPRDTTSAPTEQPAPEAAAPAAVPRATATARQIAALFGWKESPAAKPATVKPPAPSRPSVPRLRQVGFVESGNGTVSWVFKDAQTGAVLTLSLGGTSRGWTLVAVREDGFLLAFQGTPHAIPRNR